MAAAFLTLKRRSRVFKESGLNTRARSRSTTVAARLAMVSRASSPTEGRGEDKVVSFIAELSDRSAVRRDRAIGCFGITGVLKASLMCLVVLPKTEKYGKCVEARYFSL